MNFTIRTIGLYLAVAGIVWAVMWLGAVNM